jgi:uncharacterized protein (DUF1015 family)
LVRIFPFQGIRPSQEYADKVAARILGTENDITLKEELVKNPASYLNLVKPHLVCANPNASKQALYDYALEYFANMLRQNILVVENEAAIYIYKQTLADGHEFTGIITAVSVLDYLGGTIKKHENTITAKESKMVADISATSVVGEPVLIACPQGNFINDWTKSNSVTNPTLDFYDPAGLSHQIWSVTDPFQIQVISSLMLGVETLYIADGHHRIAASSDFLTRMHNEQNWTGAKMAFMAFIIPEEQLWIKPFHRLINGITAGDIENLLIAATAKFDVEQSTSPVLPANKGEFGFCSAKGWYRLRFLTNADYNSPAQNLDVSRLEKYIFHDILNITDSKTDDRLHFVRGDISTEELETLIKSREIDAAFLLHPNSMQEIKEVADANETMPPKSTWVEPKLLTGMIIQQFSE